MQSGSKWNEERNMVEGSAALWDNLIIVSWFLQVILWINHSDNLIFNQHFV
jgi:hypothetical protein